MSWDDEINIYNDPIVFLSRKGNASDPYKHIKETVEVINGKALLREVPEKTKEVVVTGENITWSEVENEELLDNYFEVDYIQGVVFFNSKNNGKSFTFDYYGKGAYYTPDTRIYLTYQNGLITASSKFKDLDRADLEQKNRVDTLIVENPQPSEVVDIRVDRNGNIHRTARDRINAEQKKIEDAYVDMNGDEFDSLKNRIDSEQRKIEESNVGLNGKSYLSLKEHFDDIDSNLNKAMESVTIQMRNNFEQYLNYEKVIFSLPTLLMGLSDYPQAFAINQERNELYIARQLNGGTTARISKYSIPSLTLLDTKNFTQFAGAYQEGLPFFYNSSNQLCFIVRKNYSGNVAIFNFDTGVLGNSIGILGSLKLGMDKDRNFLISHYGDATRTEGVHLYDFNSVKNGTPSLIKTICFPNSISNGEKVQSITIIDNKIVLGQGKNNPVISVVDFNGIVLKTVELNKRDLAIMADDFDGNINNFDNYSYENEGVSFYEYDGQILPLVAHVLDSRMYFTLCGSIDFTKLGLSINPETEVKTTGLNWINAELKTGVTKYGQDVPVQYCKDSNGMVYIRGICTHAYKGENPKLVLFTLPYPYAPKRNQFFRTVASGLADKSNRIEVYTNGDVVLESTTSVSDTPFTVLDGVFFYVDLD